MEQVSTSQRLQNAVLRVTARDNSSLDFTRTGRRKAFYGALPEGTVSLGQHVLVLGIPDESTLQFTAREIGSSGTIRLVEHQKALLERGREYTTPLEKQLGYCNWSFEHAPLDDLSTDPAFLASSLAEQPVTNVQAYQDLHEALNVQRSERPWIATGKTDVVIIDQAVNRIVASQIKPLLAEAWRVLTPGGHLVLRLLLADEPASIDLPKMPDGTVFLSIPHETEIATLLQQGGYYGIRYTWRGDLPVKVIHGVEVRSFVIEAYKQEAALQLDRGHAVVYRGPWKEVRDDAGRSYLRGERMAVSEATYQQLLHAPYQQDIFGIPCYLEVRAEEAPPFAANMQVRDPKVTKGSITIFDNQGSCCSSSSGNCCS